MKLKKMPLAEFQDVMKREWTPVRRIGDALPSWASGIPDSLFASALASGTCNVVQSQPYQSSLIPSGQLIGGFDIYRHAPDDPVLFNKDWYAVVRDVANPFMLLVDGPQKDFEHWLPSIVERCEGLEVLGVPKKTHEDAGRL